MSRWRTWRMNAARAAQVLGLPARRGIGRRPLIFVAHSLDGLLAKQILQALVPTPNGTIVVPDELAANRKGVPLARGREVAPRFLSQCAVAAFDVRRRVRCPVGDRDALDLHDVGQPAVKTASVASALLAAPFAVVQATTVAGFTITKGERHPANALESATQKLRSLGLSGGRFSARA